MIARLRRIYTYIRHGHSTYAAVPFGILNFMVIIFSLLLSKIVVFQVLFPNILKFIVIFSVLYLPIIAIAGRKDFKRGQYVTESRIAVQNNPFIQATVMYYIYLAQGETDKAISLMKKWLSNDSFEVM